MVLQVRERTNGACEEPKGLHRSLHEHFLCINKHTDFIFALLWNDVDFRYFGTCGLCDYPCL